MTEQQKRMLEQVLCHAGLSGLARCVEHMPIGVIESRVTEVLARTDIRQDVRAWRRVWGAKHTARRIRKPMNDTDDYLQDAEWTLKQ